MSPSKPVSVRLREAAAQAGITAFALKTGRGTAESSAAPDDAGDELPERLEESPPANRATPLDLGNQQRVGCEPIRSTLVAFVALVAEHTDHALTFLQAGDQSDLSD
jgi:hypothetical protein